ncbi:MAG: hypothetical protein DI619_04830 [Francisella sp.]|nr:MAG: hypothetical protein DI619_04830 [Francisella sp.]
MLLRDVLVAPALIKNLISVRQFTRDNSCSIEFDAFGFSYALQETYQEALNTDLDQLRQVVGESLARNSAFIEAT